MKETNRVNGTILDCFTMLAKSETESDRVDAGITLLKYLIQQNSEQHDNQEFEYAMKRLVRSLGGSKTTRIGFYTTLAAFLTMNPEISINKFISTVNTELHPVNSNSKSENADIYMGRILAYGALIRSKILSNSTVEKQLEIVQGLIDAGKQRSYLSFVSTSFLVEFVNQVEPDRVKKSIWPVVESEFGKPWTEQTLDSFYTLLVIKNKCPSLVNHEFSKRYFGTKGIITEQSMNDIAKVLSDLPRIVSCHHPIFKLFCENIISTARLVTEFWSCVDRKFTRPSKLDEHLAIQLLKFMLPNIVDKSIIPSLLSPNYTQYMLKKISESKNHNKDKVLVGFKQVLNLLVSAVNSDDSTEQLMKTQVAVLKKLILHPGDLMIEKKTGTKIIQTLTGNMNCDGIKKVSNIYRDIIENDTSMVKRNAKPTESFWTNAERIYAAHLLTRLMGHPKMLENKDWRIDQLKFLFIHGLCETPNVGTDLALQLKETFYRALDHKLRKLDDLRHVLSELVHFLNDHIKSGSLKLRNPLTDEANGSWEKVIRLIEKLEKNPRKMDAAPVFHTMNLHMGLQLFSDPQMAVTAIDELQSCYERVLKRSGRNKAGIKGERDEPEWVEVVVDLLLSFYSKNSHLLRSLVGCVFPHICPYVTPTTVHQILAVLDVRSEKGPLVRGGGLDDSEDDDEDDEENGSCSESNSDIDDDEEEEEKEEEGVEGVDGSCETGTSSDSDSAATASNEESMNEDDEDETVTDRLRMAVRQALGDASAQTDDEDVDVDDIDEEEGKRLDESLAAAFRILRENRRSRSKKQEKSAQALTHFRVRVIDLLETYLESSPSMAIVLDMILPLFTLLEFCIKDPRQKPLLDRVRSCLKTLSAVKKFKDTENVDEKLLTVILRSLMEKGERTTSVYHEMSDKLAECCTFLVRCAQQADVSTETVVQIYGENLTAFFKRRDRVLSPLLFRSILQLQWEGNWQLTPLLVDFAFDGSVRSFRRGYALEFLILFYNNSRLVHLDTKHSAVRMEMERKLCKHTIDTLEELSNTNKGKDQQIVTSNGNEIGKEVRQRYICSLLTLLRSVYPHHLPQAWNWNDIANTLKTYRTNVSLAKDTKTAYNRLAIQIGIPRNTLPKKIKHVQNTTVNGHGQRCTSDVQTGNVELKTKKMKSVGSTTANGGGTENGETDNLEQTDDTRESENVQNASDTEPDQNEVKKKNKRKQKDRKHQLKKEARILREKTISEGFEPFNFSSFVAHNESNGDVRTPRNGDSKTEGTGYPEPSKKRPLKGSSDGNKMKRRKRTLDTGRND